jgi:DNA-binding SARP family transcriptional activator
VEFRILGPLEVIADGQPLALGGARQRAMLALLLTRPNEVISTDRLIDELWGAEPPRTALNTVQYYVSQLRKLLGAERIETRPPGYAVRVAEDELDLRRFELLLERGDPSALRDALALWRGPALADFAYEPFAQEEIARLEELRLVAHERRVEAELQHGDAAGLVAELEQLVGLHPLRERLRGQLMLSLYRAGRQAEALAVYQDARKTLVDELGIDPGPALQELERAILRQDPALEPSAAPGHGGSVEAEARPDRSIVVSADGPNLDLLLALADPLARSVPARELIVARLVSAEELVEVTRSLQELCEALVESGVWARAAAFTSTDEASDLVRLASEQDADLVLLETPEGFLGDGVLDGRVGAVLGSASCDVGVLVARGERLDIGPDRPVLVPFGGADHDWAAVELAAWIVRATGSSLRLAGREADLAGGGRDASRLLASASLLVQRAVRVPTEPVLAAPGREGILDAARDVGLIVFGLSDRWRQDGLGETRLAIANHALVPVLLVRKGLRPGGIAPDGTMTRFTWSLGTAEAGAGRR